MGLARPITMVSDISIRIANPNVSPQTSTRFLNLRGFLSISKYYLTSVLCELNFANVSIVTASVFPQLIYTSRLIGGIQIFYFFFWDDTT